jgi:hypothetical protein
MRLSHVLRDKMQRRVTPIFPDSFIAYLTDRSILYLFSLEVM